MLEDVTKKSDEELGMLMRAIVKEMGSRGYRLDAPLHRGKHSWIRFVKVIEK